ncbi:methyltransferase [Clostridium sp. LCP25S3_F8]|uniref:methyltransferase n=1 Tax=Clostridium sp. LCP25S3_F8 TaxID=3438751 RepID=UPI003F8FC5E0
MRVQENIIMSMIQGFSASYLLYTACELDLFDKVKDGKNLEELSCEMKVNKAVLYRIMRPLIALEFIKKDKEQYMLLPLGERLTGDAKDSLKGFVLFCGRQCMPDWEKLYEAVKNDDVPHNLVEEKDYFKAQEDNSNKFDTFNSMMSRASKNLLLDSYFDKTANRFEKYSIIDVGGGTGEIIAKFLNYYKNSNGTILDLKHVKNTAEKSIKKYKLQDRCKFKDVDFFKDLEVNGDIFILSRILHDWDDDDAIKILKNIQNCMEAESKLVIIEKLLPQKIEKRYANLFMTDLNIWAMCGGKEREIKEFKYILSECELEISKIYRLENDEYVIEAKKLIREYEEGVL